MFMDVKPPFVTVEVSVQNFKAVVNTGPARSCPSDRICRLLHKVLTPSENEQLLRMDNGDLVTPIGHCTNSFRIGDPCCIVLLIVLSNCVFNVILGWDSLSSHDTVIDCINSELYLNDYDVVAHPSPNFNVPLQTMNDIVVPSRRSLIVMLAVDTASPPERMCGVVNPDFQLLEEKKRLFSYPFCSLTVA